MLLSANDHNTAALSRTPTCREGDSPVVQVQSRCDGLCASPSPCLRVYGIVPVQSSPAFSTGTGLRTLSPKQVLSQKQVALRAPPTAADQLGTAKCASQVPILQKPKALKSQGSGFYIHSTRALLTKVDVREGSAPRCRPWTARMPDTHAPIDTLAACTRPPYECPWRCHAPTPTPAPHPTHLHPRPCPARARACACALELNDAWVCAQVAAVSARGVSGCALRQCAALPPPPQRRSPRRWRKF